jgi:hypothetical protein
MQVTREIVRDLLPLYAAGEASSDTRQLVDSWLKTDPELTRDLAALRDDRPSSIASVRPLGDEAHSVIAETRRLLRRRAIYLAGALAFTGLPLLALAYRLEGVHFPLERFPAAWVTCVVLAAVFWMMFVKTMRRMRVTGL